MTTSAMKTLCLVYQDSNLDVQWGSSACLTNEWKHCLYTEGKAKSRVNYIWYRETSATDLIWKRVATPRRVLMLMLMFWHVFMCFYNSLSLWLWPLASWALYFLLTYPNLIIWYIWNFIFLLSLLRSILSPLSNTVHSHSFEVNPQSTCPMCPSFTASLCSKSKWNCIF